MAQANSRLRGQVTIALVSWASALIPSCASEGLAITLLAVLLAAPLKGSSGAVYAAIAFGFTLPAALKRRRSSRLQRFSDNAGGCSIVASADRY
jgi:hypothetical protein